MCSMLSRTQNILIKRNVNSARLLRTLTGKPSLVNNQPASSHPDDPLTIHIIHNLRVFAYPFVRFFHIIQNSFSMMAQHFFFSRVLEPVFGFLSTVPATIREGVAEVADTISPSRKRRRPSSNSIFQPQPSPDTALHPQQKRLRLSDASASNAAGPSVATPAAFRSTHDILAAATSPTQPNSQIVTRHPIPTRPPPTPLPKTASITSSPSLSFQGLFHYPVPQRRSSLTGLRAIWPGETNPHPSRRRSSTTIDPAQTPAQRYWQGVERRHRIHAATAYGQKAEKSPRDPLWRKSHTSQPHHPLSHPQSTFTGDKHPIAALTKEPSTLRRTSFAPTLPLASHRTGIQKRRTFNNARLRKSYHRTVKRLTTEGSLRRSHATKAIESSDKGFSENASMGLAKDTIPKPFVEILEQKDSILSQKLLKIHGPALRRLAQSHGRSRYQQLECWFAERDLREIQRKRKEAKRLHAIESRTRKHADHHFQKPPKDDGYVHLDYWHEEDSDWNESTDKMAVAERKKQVTVSDEMAAFSPLSESAVRRLRAVLNDRGNQHETLSKIDGCIITGEDLRRLNPNCWLNDEIVNAYMALLSARTERFRTKSLKSSPFSSCTVPSVKIMSSFFYSKLVQFNRKLGKHEYNYSRVRRWTRRFDVFSFDVLLIPINEQNVHWTLGVVDMRNRTVEHLDSMGTGGSPSVREYLMQWVRDEAEDKQKSVDPSKWKTVERIVPIQENTDDCGVFLCKYADFICRGWTKFTFSQRHMNYFRARIAHELLMGKA